MSWSVCPFVTALKELQTLQTLVWCGWLAVFKVYFVFPAAALVRDQAEKVESRLLDITLTGVDFKGGDLKGVGPVDVASAKVRGFKKTS